MMMMMMIIIIIIIIIIKFLCINVLSQANWPITETAQHRGTNNRGR